MTKLSVREIVADSYKFTFGHLGKVIALIWLPIVVLTVGGYFVMAPYFSGMSAAYQEDDIAAQGPLLVRMFGFELVCLVLFTAAAVAITREILKPRGGPNFLRIRLGAEEFRTMGGLIGLFLVLLVAGIVAGILGGILAGVVATLLPGALKLAKAAHAGCDPAMVMQMMKVLSVAWLIAGAAVIYFALRLGFLLVPAAVMEDKFGLESSWRLTKGNFWRILAISVATLAPVVILSLAVEFILLGPDFYNPHLEQICDPAAHMRLLGAQMQAAASRVPLAMGLSFLFAPITYGLMISPAVFAYRALTAKAEPPAA
jgi:hypothetical protein